MPIAQSLEILKNHFSQNQKKDDVAMTAYFGLTPEGQNLHVKRKETQRMTLNHQA